MIKEGLILAATAAYFSGKGYYVESNFNLPGTDLVMDVAAILPRMKDFKSRFKRGFAPGGVINCLIGVEWLTFKEIVDVTGFNLSFIRAVLEDAAQEGWVELAINEQGPKARLKDYRNPAKECVLAFIGTQDLESKLSAQKSLEGCYNRTYYVFPYSLDEKTIELIVKTGGGIIKYFQSHGVFLEVVPPQTFAIEDHQRFAILAEKVLYNNTWILTEEII